MDVILFIVCLPEACYLLFMVFYLFYYGQVDAILAEEEIREAFKIFDIDGERLFFILSLFKKSFPVSNKNFLYIYHYTEVQTIIKKKT